MRQCPVCSRIYADELETCPLDATALSSPDPVLGTVQEGNYRIDAMLGRGGMGAVYRATQLSLDRTVAFKIVLAAILEDPVALERFKREALAIARLRHPNIVAIFDYGVTQNFGAYIVMEYIEGRSLKDAVKQEGALPVRLSCELMKQMCAAVGAAHGAGVIHRDLKPHNIMLREGAGSPVAKVLDFGLAKMQAADLDGASLTAGGALLGTPMYMSPEQCSSMALDARSDLYSLGCVFYEMLTGQPPFPDKAMATVLVKHLTATPKPPSEIAPAVPKALDVVLMKALEKQPPNRYQTAAEMVEAIDAAVSVEDSLVSGATNPSFGAEDPASDIEAIMRLWSRPLPQIQITPPPPVETTNPTSLDEPAQADTPDAWVDSEESTEASMLGFLDQLPGSESQEPTLMGGSVAAPMNQIVEEPSLGSAYRASGPPSRSAFVGRARELAEIAEQLASVRALTLVGAGGIGKTRLAIEAAARAHGLAADGSCFVEFPTLLDPSLVPQKLASALGLRESPNTPLIDTLIEHLRPKRMHLVLDNCEHLVETCAPIVARILDEAPGVRIISASREAFGVTGEVIWHVPPLELPALDLSLSAREGLEYDALRLFSVRASAANPTFTMDDARGGSVARICHQLGGIPLAIELTAARAGTLHVREILEQLKREFRLATGGGRTTMVRYQTLRAAIDWSWEGLGEPERALLRRLSVFVGGWSADAALAVCSQEPVYRGAVPEMLDLLAERAFLQVDSDSGRYRMLEPVRQYAWERLREAREDTRLLARHLHWCVDLAQSADARLGSAESDAWIERLEADHDNLLAALRWGHGEFDGREASVKLCEAMLRFWDLRGYVSERRRWLEATTTGLSGTAM